MLKNEEGIIQIAVNENQQHQQQIYFQGEVIRQLQHQQQQQELQLQQQQQQIQQQQQQIQQQQQQIQQQQQLLQQQQQQLLNQQIQNPNMNGPLLSNRNDNHVFVIPFIKYEEIEPNHDTQQYFKNLLKKICQEYKGINFGTWIGAVNPRDTTEDKGINFLLYHVIYYHHLLLYHVV